MSHGEEKIRDNLTAELTGNYEWFRDEQAIPTEADPLASQGGLKCVAGIRCPSSWSAGAVGRRIACWKSGSLAQARLAATPEAR